MSEKSGKGSEVWAIRTGPRVGQASEKIQDEAKKADNKPNQQKGKQKGFLSGAEVSTSDIGIAGLRVVFDRRIPWFRRIMWAAVLVVCTVLTFMQGLERFQNYEDRPVTVRVRIIRNESLPFPFITICPFMACDRHLLSPVKLRELWTRVFPNKPFPAEDKSVLDQVGFSGTEEEFFGGISRWGSRERNYSDYQCDRIKPEDKVAWVKERHQILAASALLAAEMGSSELWRQAAFVNNSMFEQCYLGRGLECDERGRFDSVMTINGQCITYKPQRVTLGGMYHGLYMKLISGSNLSSSTGGAFAWSVLLHGEGQPPHTAAFTHGYYVDANQMEKDIAATLRTFKAQNTPKKRCEQNPSEEDSFCIINCYENTLAKMTNCKLPFMRTTAYPECKTSIDYLRASVLAIDMLEGVRQGVNDTWDFEKDCRCAQPCYRELFELQSDTGYYDSVNRSLLRVYLPDLSYEEISEEINYGVIPLLCDFGGTLGLLLGASVLTMVEIIEVLIAKLTSIFTPSGTKKQSEIIPEEDNKKRTTLVKTMAPIEANPPVAQYVN